MTLSPADVEAITRRHHIVTMGQGGPPMLFAHGFGCDQGMWRSVAPAFAADHRVVLFDHVGCGAADRAAYRIDRYQSLHGYADDLVQIIVALDLRDVVFVGHSVSAMIGLLASKRLPDRFSRLIMVGPSPRYVDDENYRGGFSRADIDELLDLLDTNHYDWSHQMAPVVMGNPHDPNLSRELANSFCRMDPLVARHFARVTFLSDMRAELAGARVPCLILQCTDDVIAPVCVGEYLHQQIAGSQYVVMRATGHCPHLSAPHETIQRIREYLTGQPLPAPNATAPG